MTSTFVTQVKDLHHRIEIEKNIWIREGLVVGDYVEVTVRRIEKTPKSESGGPYSQ